jgi:hypothetical protein
MRSGDRRLDPPLRVRPPRQPRGYTQIWPGPGVARAGIIQSAMPDYKTMFEQLADAYNRRDPDAFVAPFHPDCEWHPVLARPEGDPGYHGHSGNSSLVRGRRRDV